MKKNNFLSEHADGTIWRISQYKIGQAFEEIFDNMTEVQLEAIAILMDKILEDNKS